MEKTLTRKNKFILNTVSSILNQFITIICGFVLPRNMLLFFGSEINGMVSSITQFLNFISFLQFGVGTVIHASWYRPLSDNNYQKISQIYVSAQKFFRKIALIFLLYTLFTIVFYTVFMDTKQNDIYISSLILVIAFSLFTQYFWGITNSLLLNADQKGYIPLMLSSIITLLNTIISLLLMYNGQSILIVKLGSTIVHLVNPIILSLYVNKCYKINKKIEFIGEPIRQKWNGFAQHVSAVIVDNTDIIVLTILSTLENVSIYSVYHMVVASMKNLIMSLTHGIQALFGNMLARGEIEKLKDVFNRFELFLSFIITFFYTCTSCLVVPFIEVYTQGVNDISYKEPYFAILLTIAYAIFGYRTIYYTLIKAAGHFKETQQSAIIEAILNLVISIVCVIHLGLIGVAIGTLIAMIYRTFYCVWYLSKNIIRRNIREFIFNMFVNMCIYVVSFQLSHFFELSIVTYFSWIILALKVGILNFVVCVCAYIIAYPKRFIQVRNFIIYQFIKH